MKFTVPLVLAGTLMLLAGGLCRADMPVLTLNDANEPPFTTTDRNGFVDAVAFEAFRRAGVQLRLVKLPAERGLINANAGTEDGDLTRIAGLDTLYPNLVQVPEKLIDWEFVAFGKNPTLPAKMDVLRTQPIGHIRGWKIYENMLAGSTTVVASDDAEQLFRQLQLNRIDVALYERWLGVGLLRKQGIKGVYPLEPALAKREMYIYLHKRHAALVPKIAEALRAIKAEGLYAKLYKEKVLSLAVTTSK
ncbi:MAG: transporter substrate-binding domain-containing protein [Thiobacillus sp.]|nr:transporter substrate-binding domain-containing protein [Thiobacillus sp.]